MHISFFDISSFSIGIAAITSWIRFGKINSTYYPFLICISLALLNETICGLVADSAYNFNINNNIYVLLESLLILWQFRNWGSFINKKYLFFSIAFIFLLVWVVENFIVGNLEQVASYFRVVYSFILVLLAINQINKIIIRERKNILTNPIFLICVGVVCYYTYKVLVELFWVYGLPERKEFKINLYLIHAWLNLFSNLIYAFAVLWMQKRQRFLLPS